MGRSWLDERDPALTAEQVTARRAELGQFTVDTALRWPCDCGHLAGHHLPEPFLPCGRCQCQHLLLGLVRDPEVDPPVASRDAQTP